MTNVVVSDRNVEPGEGAIRGGFLSSFSARGAGIVTRVGPSLRVRKRKPVKIDSSSAAGRRATLLKERESLPCGTPADATQTQWTALDLLTPATSLGYYSTWKLKMMPPERRQPVEHLLTFDAWKLHFRKDCELQNKLIAFNALGDDVLRILWQSGLEPSVTALRNSSVR